MFVITPRSIGFSAAMVFTLLSSAAAAQDVQSTSDHSPRQPVIQPNVTAGDNDDAELVLAEPDFRVLNLPSTLRLPRHGSSFQLTHRFNGNLRQGSFNENASNLFGLDQGAVVGFEYRFGIARHLQAAVYRTAIDKTFQFHGKYDAVRQGASMPLSLSALVSVEGADNFQEHYSPALGVVVSRNGRRQARVIRDAGLGSQHRRDLDIDRDTFFVGIGGRVRVGATVYLVGEVVPRAGGFRPDKRPSASRSRSVPADTCFNSTSTTARERRSGKSRAAGSPTVSTLASISLGNSSERISKGRTA